MRTYAFMVGVWCGSLQMSLIYCMSFLWSATPRAAIWVLLLWLLGSLGGVQRGDHRLHPLQWCAPGLFLLGSLWLSQSNILWVIVVFSSFLGGFAAGQWFAVLEIDFVRALRWESLGMALGFALASVAVYLGLQVLVYGCLLWAVVLAWKEARCRHEAGRGLP